VGDYDGAIRHLQWLTALASPDSASRERIWNPFVGEELRYVLAYVHQQASRWDDATRLYQELLEQNLGLDVAHSHLAEIYEAQGRWPEAIQERRRAIEVNPEEPGFLFDLGSTLAYGGLYAEAEETLATYANTHPRESRIYYLLGFVRMRLGKVGSARDALTQYLALAPHRYEQQIADAKQRLATLGP
jgi:predicted Zn-dependent protease